MGKTSLRASIIAAALLIIAGAADAAGLGKLTVLSHLGEPLRAEIDVVAPEKGELETLNARLASPDAYVQSSLPYPPVALGLQMALDKRPSGESFIKVTTQQPVPEPFIDLLVELNWRGGKIVRAYTALLDPPGLAAAPPAAQPPAATTAAAPPAAKPAPAPAPEIETRMGSEMQLPPPEAPPPAEVVAAPAPPAEATGGETLPPLEQAQPAPAAVPAAPAEAGMPPKGPAAAKEAGNYTVKYGDTLSKIAKQNKAEDVSLDQMLVLLFRSNPDAFSGKNMNRLKTGKILSVPDPSEAAGIPQKEARKQVRVQVADFRAYRERLAAAAGAAMPAPEEQATGGKVTGPVTEKATPPAGEPKEVLKLSKGDSAAGASTQQRIHSLEEEIAARDRTIRDANDRIAKLEKTVRDMQSLLDVKSKPMAELQQKQAAAPPQPTPVPPPPAAHTPPAPQPNASTATTPPPAHPEPAPAAAPPAPPVPAVGPPPVAPAPGPMAASGTQPGTAAVQPKPKPKVVAPPPPPASFLDELLEEPTYLLGGGAIVALILGFLGYRFIRGRRAAADFGAEKKTSDISDFPAAPSESIVPAAAPSTRGAGAPAPASEEVDPLAEAEIYLAYGRDGQAEEILKEALQAHPRRPEIHLKLLEIFAKRKDLAAFDTSARELQQITGGAGETWAQAARLGYQLEPGNTRYAAGKPSADETAAAAAAAAPAANHTLDIQIDSLEPSPEIGTLTDIDAGFGRRFATSAAATATADRLDLNVSIDDGQQPGTKTDIDLGNLAAAVNATPVDLDLDSLGRPTAGPASDLNTLATLGVDRTSQTPVMDFNLELPPASDDTSQSQMAKVDSVDFDLKLDDTAMGGTSASGVDFDIDKIDAGGKPEPVLDLGAPSASMPDLDLSNINLDLGGGGATQEAEVGGKDDKWYDVQTKLDLAKAYQEMGDKEGAKEILREVLAEGDAEQKAAANKVLETL